MPNKAKVYCQECDKIYTITWREASELSGRTCKKCGSEDIFYRDLIYEEEPDRTPLKLGDRGCGTNRRFE